MRYALVALTLLSLSCQEPTASATPKPRVIPGPCWVRLMWWADTTAGSTSQGRIIISQRYTGVGDNPCPDSVWIERD